MHRDYGQKPPELPPGSPMGGGVPPPLPPVPAPTGNRKKGGWGILAAIGVMLAKFKGLLFPILKFFPVLFKTGGTMILSIWAYAMFWGWQFAAGFVVLIFIHECGHLLAAKRIGLNVGAPVFIPFMGAFIALKEAPRNAWIESQVGIGGPLLGAIGSAVCFLLYPLTGNALFAALAYSGFFLNLFNLAPLAPLDGGRIVTALSPWLWVVGLVVLSVMMVVHFNILLLIIIVVSLPRLFTLFREKTPEEVNYFQVTTAQRWIMGSMYIGLASFLAWEMAAAHEQLAAYHMR